MILIRIIRNVILDEETDDAFISSYNRFGHLSFSIQITTDVLLKFARIDDLTLIREFREIIHPVLPFIYTRSLNRLLAVSINHFLPQCIG